MQPFAFQPSATGLIRIRTALCAIAVLGLAIACNAPPAPAADAHVAAAPERAPAGTVEHLEGQVLAVRAGQVPPARTLAGRAPVWADDTVTTAPEASVGIRLLHNGALWELQGGQTRRVDQGLAWKAARSVQAVALADHAEAPATAAAGRHSEQEAAQSAETAARPEPVPVRRPKPAATRRPVTPTPPPGVTYKKRSAYEFDDDVVSGDLLKPDREMAPPPPSPPQEAPPVVPQEHARLDIGEKMFQADESRPAAPVVLGSLSPESVQRFLQPIRKQFQKCYEQALRQDPTAAGRLNIHIEFGADGRVALVRAESATLPPQVGTCIESVIKRRPKSAMKSVSVQVPLVFKPAE